MNSKKITVVLLVVGAVAFTFVIFTKVDIKRAFVDSVKQNVVYTKDDTSTVSQEDFYVSGTEEKAYKEKSSEILKKYFNISIENNKKLKFQALKINEKTLDEMKAKSIKELKDLYENKKISKEEYDKQMKMHDGGPDDIDALFKYRIDKLKRGVVSTTWQDDNRCYLIIFNENTKEIDFVSVNEGHYTKSEVPLTLSEEQLKNMAKDFIKQNKLGNIENPKCILVKEDGTKNFSGYHSFYQDGNDQSKKVMIGIDEKTGKVRSFAVNSYADCMYDEDINEK